MGVPWGVALPREALHNPRILWRAVLEAVPDAEQALRYQSQLDVVAVTREGKVTHFPPVLGPDARWEEVAATAVRVYLSQAEEPAAGGGSPKALHEQASSSQ
jgi:hypothetical protein